MTKRVSAALAVAWALAVGASCGSLPKPQLCGQIPEGGCPIGRGGSCDDAACQGLYDCVEGAWTLEISCGQGGGGGGGGAGGGGEGGGGGCTPVTLDHTGEVAGCTPDLQIPDCPAVAAETCAETACLTGCVDFFLCTADGWDAVAYCTEEGQVIVTP